MSNQLFEARVGPRTPTDVCAFFDVDNTLIPGRSIEERFFFHLFRQRIIGLREVLASLWFLLRHVPPVSRQPLREHKLYLQGLCPGVIEPLAKQFIESVIRPRLSSEALGVLSHHRSLGHQIVLVTASLDFLVAPLATWLQVDALFAAVPELKNDIYTGHLRPLFPYGEGKRQVAEQYAKEKQIDLSQSYAYGDSPGDLDILKVVGFPHVVNPIRGMKAMASRKGWPMTRWH